MTDDLGMGTLCNSCCVMCTSIVPADPKKQPSTEKLISTIDNELFNHDCITITGGEPTIRDDLFEVLEYINKTYPKKKIHLITNGRRCAYQEYVQRLAKIKNLRISTELHGSTAELNDAITFSPGSFDQAYKGIKNLLSAGFEVEFRIVISKLNYKDVPIIAQMVVKEFTGVSHVVMFPIDLVGNAARNREKLLVRYDELVPFVEEAVDILKETLPVKLYHIPYCVISDPYHPLIQGVTVPERRITFANVCRGCRFEEKCPRVWKSYAVAVGIDEFKRI